MTSPSPSLPPSRVRGRDEARANFVRLFASIPDVSAAMAERENEVWIEWRISGTRDDGTVMEFVGVNIFGVEDETIVTLATRVPPDASAWGQARMAAANSAAVATEAIKGRI